VNETYVRPAVLIRHIWQLLVLLLSVLLTKQLYTRIYYSWKFGSELAWTLAAEHTLPNQNTWKTQQNPESPDRNKNQDPL
jgi:hypothetical protein